MKFVPFTIALGIIGVIGGIMALVGGVGLFNLGLDWVLGVESCSYIRAIEQGVEAVKDCSRDMNAIKRDLAQSVSLIAVGMPVAIFSYFKIRKG